MSVFAPQVRNLCKSLLEAITYSIAEVFPLPPTCRVFLETLKYIPKYLPRVSVTPPSPAQVTLREPGSTHQAKASSLLSRRHPSWSESSPAPGPLRQHLCGGRSARAQAALNVERATTSPSP